MAFLTKSYPLIPNATEYWLGLLGAVLSCLHDHNLLQHRPDRFGLSRESWSLKDFRGLAPNEAISVVRASLANWGFQYLLADILNDTSLPYMTWLRNGLCEATETDLGSSTGVAYISGADSQSSHGLEGKVQGRLLWDRRRTFARAHSEVRNTDLCVVFEGALEYPVVALGEVEGVHGSRVTSPGFWASKSPATNFGIGVVEEGAGVQVGVTNSPAGRRFVMLFGANQGLARDFMDALDWVRYLLDKGPNDRQRQRAEAGLKEALGHIASRFSDPVVSILTDLRRGGLLAESKSKIYLLDATGAAPPILHTPGFIIVNQ